MFPILYSRPTPPSVNVAATAFNVDVVGSPSALSDYLLSAFDVAAFLCGEVAVLFAGRMMQHISASLFALATFFCAGLHVFVVRVLFACLGTFRTGRCA